MRSLSTIFQLAFLLLFLAACTSRDLEEGDRDLVLKIEQLQPYGLSIPPNFSDFESFKREQWFDGSVTIEYEFEAPEQLGLPYLYSVAELHSTRADACSSYATGNLGVRMFTDEISERNDLFRFGDKSRFWLLMAEGSPYGNYFGMCRGKTAFMVILGGFYFDDGDAWGDLLETTLDAVGSMR